jgi:hypothetical protein
MSLTPPSNLAKQQQELQRQTGVQLHQDGQSHKPEPLFGLEGQRVLLPFD